MAEQDAHSSPNDPYAANRVYVREHFAFKLQHCTAMIDRVAEEINPWPGAPLESPADRIIALILPRSLTTARAAVYPCEVGFGIQGAMLNRALFEDFIDIGWTICNPDEAVELHGAHERREELALQASLAKLPANPAAPVEPLMTEAEAELAGETRFGKYGEKHWTRLSTHWRIEGGAAAWDERELIELRAVHEIAHHRNNLLLHSSPVAHRQHLAEETSDYVKAVAGPNMSELERTLMGTAWTIGALAQLFTRHFAFPRAAEFAEWRDRQERRALSLEALDLTNIGRNDPCPCDSGDKFKRCHGARLRAVGGRT